MKKFIFLLLITIFAIKGFSQETNEFQPGGKPLALVFANFNTAFSDGETAKAFEITRTYLGYEYNFSKQWYAKVVFDVGDPKAGELQMTAYLKNAYAQYKNNGFTAQFGMISTTQFKVSEKIWGLRYIEKSFQDAYKFNASADLGFNIDYQFADFISADFSVVNGEGYKKVQSDDYLRPGAGITVTPVKNITARVYGDIMGKDSVQSSLATFLAFSSEKFTIAGEYNYQKNMGMTEGHDIYGTSFFAVYEMCENFSVYGRFDDLKSVTPEGENDPWNLNKDGQLIIAGVEYSPVKGINIAPNFRYWNPANNSPSTTFAYLNFEFKF